MLEKTAFYHSLSAWKVFLRLRFYSMFRGRPKKNVWMSDKSWEPEHSHSLSHFHTLTLSLFHSLIHSLSTCWTTFVFMSMLKSHSLTFTLSHSHTLALSHSFNLSFTHSRHAEQVLFSCLGSKVAVYSRKLQCFFFDLMLFFWQNFSFMVFLGPHQHPLLWHCRS